MTNLVIHISGLKDLQQEITEFRFVVLDCSGTFCMPCRKIAPLVKQLAWQNLAVRFLECTEHADDIMSAFAIRAFPTFLFFCDGRLMKHRVVSADIVALTQAVQALQHEPEIA